ncbi:MAG: hypothetical protein HDR72_05465 [Ruminococcaceae bacterium]|nr:hypothetical protein [Oscillospiraceae bacterium]
MDKWDFLDWTTFVSGLIGAASLVLTILTLIKAGTISKAVIDTQNNLINKFKYVLHLQDSINKLEKIMKKFNVALKSKKEIKQIYSSGEIKQFFYQFKDVILCLLECTDHLKDKHKEIIADCDKYIKAVDTSYHIFDEGDCNTLQKYISEVLNILKQEDYLL